MASKSTLTPRHKMLAFFGVKVTVASGEQTSTTATTFHRMKKFTQLTQNKNPQEYNRKYVDEATQRNDVTGFSPQIDYAFDRYTNDPVLTDIAGITNSEAVGSDAIRTIILVDVDTGEAFKRDYAVIPGSEGDDANVYTYSGSFKANGELVNGTATSEDDWQTVTFTESE